MRMEVDEKLELSEPQRSGATRVSIASIGHLHGACFLFLRKKKFAFTEHGLFFFFLSMLCFIICSPRYAGRSRKGFLFSSAIDFFFPNLDASGTFLFILC